MITKVIKFISVNTTTLQSCIMIFFALLFMTLGFYWFEWRPSRIRKDCYVKSVNNWQKRFDYWDRWDGDPDGKIYNQAETLKFLNVDLEKERQNFYNQCLNGNGLK